MLAPAVSGDGDHNSKTYKYFEIDSELVVNDSS